MSTKAKNKKNKRKQRKILGLFILTGLSITVLVVGTYAWFIGTNVVKVNEIELEVLTGENLLISLDGENFDTEIDIDLDTIEDAYEGNTNHLPGTDGLQPISTDGAVDSTAERLKLYGKSSLTATAGGFRLMSTRINNYSVIDDVLTSEQDGYFTFDVFIQNGKDDTYIPEYDITNEESIYLTRKSKVQISTDGGGDPGYGLENSVRVAFMQIGRVSNKARETTLPDYDLTNITGINCTTAGLNTGTCFNEKVAIWEPNDTQHDETLIDFVGGICKNRGSGGVYTTTPCNAIQDGVANTTYVVNQNIGSADQVDVYDGLNGYTTSKLTAITTFTDTIKNVTGNDRKEIFSLAPNSITKIRIYIYLEGQDIDNYDLITRGKKIRINFGLTKDKYDMDTDDDEE